MTELTERGSGRAILRLSKHFLSLSPVFEVFSTQIYKHSILNNLTYGGARYIATGRGFRHDSYFLQHSIVSLELGSLLILSSRFAGPSIYLGMRTLILLLYITMAVWVPHLIYFWITVVGLCIAPFIFNPHQFSYADFIIDYREFLRWMSRGNSRTHANSWVGYCRLSRNADHWFQAEETWFAIGEGEFSFMMKASPDGLSCRAMLRVPPWKAIVVGEIIGPICLACLFVICYLFVKSFAVDGKIQPGLLRIAIIALGPIVFNMALLVVLFLVSVFLGPCVSVEVMGELKALVEFVDEPIWRYYGLRLPTLAQSLAWLVFFEFLVSHSLGCVQLCAESISGSSNCGIRPHAVLGIIAVISVQRCIFKILIAVFLSREFKT